jgi:hypothetical protein
MMIWNAKSQSETPAEPSAPRMGEGSVPANLATVPAAWPTGVAQVSVTPETFKTSKPQQN